MRSLVLALALGASALGVTALPTSASAAHPAPACKVPVRVYHPAHYYRAARVHYRYYRPAVPVYNVPAYPSYPACVPAPPCR